MKKFNKHHIFQSIYNSLFDEDNSEINDSLESNDNYNRNVQKTYEYCSRVFLVNEKNIEIFKDKTTDIPLINIHQDISIPDKNIIRFPSFFNFNIIYGDFNVQYNLFYDMYSFPRYIYGDCLCFNNYLKNFDGCPRIIKGSFNGILQRAKTEVVLSDENLRKYILKEYGIGNS